MVSGDEKIGREQEKFRTVRCTNVLGMTKLTTKRAIWLPKLQRETLVAEL
jgi:hypothetical protein